MASVTELQTCLPCVYVELVICPSGRLCTGTRIRRFLERTHPKRGGVILSQHDMRHKEVFSLSPTRLMAESYKSWGGASGLHIQVITLKNLYVI